MTWEQVVFLRFLAGMPTTAAFTLLGNAPPRERSFRIMLQYAWTMLFIAAVAIIWGFTPSKDLWPIFVIGMLMPFAVFFQWKATAISPSRTGIFSEASSIIPLAMSAVLLDEWKAFASNEWLFLGLVLVLISIALHARADIIEKRKKDPGALLTEGFLRNAFGFMLIFAVATFLSNYWAKTGIHAPEFIVAWYSGAFVSSVILFAAMRHLPRSADSQLHQKERLLIFLAAVGIFCSLGLGFVALTLVEQTVALPIMSVGNIVGAVLVGMCLEKKFFKGWGWLYIAIGFAGALIMAISH